MGLYLAFTSKLINRKSGSVFYFDKEKCVLKQGRKTESLFEYKIEHGLSIYRKIVSIAESKKLDSYEMVLINDFSLKEFLIFLTDYLLDKDISIGLLTFDAELINNERELLESFGVTYPNAELHKYRNELFIPSFCLAKTDIASSESDEDICINGSSEKSGMPCLLKPVKAKKKPCVKLAKNKTIELDESFHDKFMKLLIESGKDNVEVYKKAGITRQVFSKILSDKDMIPSKLTLVSLCIGLELPLFVAKELMVSAGYSLSRSLVFDSIVMKYLREEIYDFELINSELDEYGCQLLGWHPRDN